MRYYLVGCIVVTFALLMLFGCSSSGSKMLVSPDGDQTPMVDNSSQSHVVTQVGTFEIDIAKMEIREVPLRDAAFHMDITSLIKSYFHYYITGVSWPYINVKLEITNPTAIQAYDVRIIYLDLYGKDVVNPDGYTNYLDKPSGPDFNPFTYFAKEYANQAFPVGPGAKDDEMLQLRWNPGAQAYVTYAIECCLQANAEEPYKIDEFTLMGSLTPNGGASMVSCKVHDWQSDITNVTILANDFYSGDLPMYSFRGTNVYVGNLVNLNTVTPGDHWIWIKAESNSPLGIAYWMPFKVAVADDIDDAAKFTVLPFSTREIVSKGVFTYLNGFAEDPEGDDINFQWEQISPFNPAGQFSGSGGRYVPYARWDAPQVLVDTPYLFRINAKESNGTKTSRALVYLINMAPLAPEIVDGPELYPNPIYEGQEGQFGIYAIDPMFPTETAPFDYVWEQMSPISPQGTWEGTSNGHGQYPVWIAPSVDADTDFSFRITVKKWWVSPVLATYDQLDFVVKNR